jgi:hypothetical protein
MNLEHPDLKPFEPTLRRLLDLAFHAGIDALEKRGLKMDAIQGDAAARRRFFRGCHYGYDLAQRQIGDLVMEIDKERRELIKRRRELRRLREPSVSVLDEKIYILETRERVLRRIIDAILATMFRFQTWMMRRLVIDPKTPRPPSDALRETLEYAIERNAANRLRFCLVADLTTYVQLGDLIEIEIDPARGIRMSIVELKEGKVNELLHEYLQEKKFQLNPADLEELRADLGKHAPRQALRMLSQFRVLREVEKIIKTDKGIDPSTKMEIRLSKEPVATDSYVDAIVRACDEADKTGVGASVVDNCLRIVAAQSSRIGGDLGAVAHCFFHMANPSKPCLLQDKTQWQNEILEMRNIPIFVDLVEQNLRSAWGQPVFVWLQDRRLLDVLTGRLRIFVQFDLDGFFKLAAEHGIKMSWVSGKEAEKIKRLSRVIPGSPGAHGVKAELPDGSSQTLLLGFVGRAIADITTPRQLLELIKRFPDAAFGDSPKSA